MRRSKASPNRRLEVKLRLNFEGVHPRPPDPWADFCPTIVWVTGTWQDGSAPWHQYMRCVFDRQLKRVMVDCIRVGAFPEKPGPVEIAALEQQVRQFVLPQVLEAHRSRIR